MKKYFTYIYKKTEKLNKIMIYQIRNQTTSKFSLPVCSAQEVLVKCSRYFTLPRVLTLKNVFFKNIFADLDVFL